MFNQLEYLRKLKGLTLIQLKAELGMIGDETILSEDTIKDINLKLKGDLDENEIDELNKQITEFEKDLSIRKLKWSMVETEMNKRSNKKYNRE